MIFDFLRRKTAVEVKSAVPVVARSRRNYAAAATVARYADFRSSAGSADYELLDGIAPVRNKLRNLARNSGTMKRYLQLLRDNVIGSTGFTLQVRVKKSTTGDLDETLNTKVEAAWKEWCKAPTTIGPGVSMVEFCKLMVTTWGREGEFIFEIVVNQKYRDGVALHAIESDQLDHTLNTRFSLTGNEIRLGVEVDKEGQPVAYHFLTYHPGDYSWTMPQTNKKYRRVPADRIVHVFERLRPGQTRGEAPGSAIVNPVKMLDGYREAEVTNRRIAASAMGFFVNDKIDSTNGLDALADGVSDDGTEFQIEMEPGTFKELPAGKRFEKFDPGGSQTDYADFETQVKKDISMGLNVSVVALGMETAQISYSTWRGVTLGDRDMYRGLQGFFIRSAIERIFAAWLPFHVLSGTSEIPASRIAAVMTKHLFRPRGWEWIDPLKEAKAVEVELNNRITSHSQVAADQGVDFTDRANEIAEDEKLMEKLGLTRTVVDDTSSATISGDDDED